MSEITTKKKVTAFTLIADRQYYEWLLAQSEGEITPELEAYEKELSKHIATKVDSIYAFVSRLEALADADLEESRALAHSARVKTKAITRLNEMLRYHMERSGIHELASEKTSFKLVACKHSLDIDEESLPAEYWRDVVKREPNKEMIRDALERGESVTGARLTGGTALRKSLGRRI